MPDLLGEPCGLLPIAIDHHQRRRPGREEGQQGAAGRAPGAQQEHPLAGQRLAEVDLDVAQQADAVEVLRQHPLPLELQRIGRLGQARPFAGLGGQLEGLQLEGRRDIHAPPALGAKARHVTGKILQRAFDGTVLQVLAAGCGE